MPAAEVSMSAKYSPCAASRGATARHDSSTAAAPPALNTNESTIVRSSRRSAPAMRSFGSPHCQMPSPMAATKPASASSGTSTSRTARGRSSPMRSTSVAAPSSASSGDSPAQSMCGPLGVTG